MTGTRGLGGASAGWLRRRRRDGRAAGWEGASTPAAAPDRRTALLAAATVAAGTVAVEVTALRAASAEPGDSSTEPGDSSRLVFRVGGTVEDIAPGDYAPNTAVVIRPAP